MADQEQFYVPDDSGELARVYPISDVPTAEGQTVTTRRGPDGALLLGFGAGGAGAGRWEPVTNGDLENPEILFCNGDVVMAFVEGT